jgi:citrate lyase beta subunit
MLFPNFRSILISSALKIDLYNKGSASNADIFMIDFEDSVSMKDKNNARHEFLVNKNQIKTNCGYNFRINCIHSIDGIRDIMFLIDNSINVNYILVSKASSSIDLKLIKNLFVSASVKPPKLISLIETAEAMINIDDIAKYSDALLFGSADLSLELGLPPTFINNLAYYRQQVVLCACKYKIPAIDTPTFMLRNKETLTMDVLESKQIGFSGKLAISKSQVEIINEMYQYDSNDIEWANSISHIDNNITGILSVKDIMVGNPFYKLAQKIVTTSKK